jgi:MFS family permease
MGFVLSGIALTCLMYGTERAGAETSGILEPLLFIGASLAAGWLAYRHAGRCAHPLIDFTTMRVPTFSVTVISGSITRVAVNAVPYLLPLMFQLGFGMSAFDSGLLLLASALGNLGMKALTTPILKRYGFRGVAIADVSLVAVFTLACGWLSPATPLAAIALVLFAYGLTRSLQFTLLATLAYADIPAPQMSGASTLWSAAQQMMNGMGIAFGALALRTVIAVRGGDDHYRLADFRWALALSALLALLSLPGYFGMARDAGAHIRGAAERRARA